MCCTWFWQAILRFPDGSAAAGVPVNIKVSTSENSWQGPTNQQGAVLTVFNIPSVSHITVEVSGELDGTVPFPQTQFNAVNAASPGVSGWSSAVERLWKCKVSQQQLPLPELHQQDLLCGGPPDCRLQQHQRPNAGLYILHGEACSGASIFTPTERRKPLSPSVV